MTTLRHTVSLSQLVSSTNSNPLSVKYGVPQGSSLEPFLFILAMKAVLYYVSNDLLLYSDSTTLYARLHEPTLAWESSDKLFNMTSEWFSDNKLTFNGDKTQKILFNLLKIDLKLT